MKSFWNVACQVALLLVLALSACETMTELSAQFTNDGSEDQTNAAPCPANIVEVSGTACPQDGQVCDAQGPAAHCASCPEEACQVIVCSDGVWVDEYAGACDPGEGCLTPGEVLIYETGRCGPEPQCPASSYPERYNPESGLCEYCMHRDPHPYEACECDYEWVAADFPYCAGFDADYRCLPCE